MAFEAISDGELFKDLQISCADIVLMEILNNEHEFGDRLSREREILSTIKSIIRGRFTNEDLTDFLINGYKRKI